MGRIARAPGSIPEHQGQRPRPVQGSIHPGGPDTLRIRVGQTDLSVREGEVVVAIALRKKKTGPLRVRFEFVGAGADNHLPEGNSYRHYDCDLGGWATVHQQQRVQYAPLHESHNTKRGMPAMRTSHD